MLKDLLEKSLTRTKKILKMYYSYIFHSKTSFCSQNNQSSLETRDEKHCTLRLSSLLEICGNQNCVVLEQRPTLKSME